MGKRCIFYRQPFDHEASLYRMFTVYFAYVDNEDYKRMYALRAFIDAEYRQDLISNDLGEWIMNGQSHCPLQGASMIVFLRVCNHVQTP